MDEQTKQQATGDVLEVGTAPNGQAEVTLTCTREEARAWAALLYKRVSVVAAKENES